MGKGPGLNLKADKNRQTEIISYPLYMRFLLVFLFVLSLFACASLAPSQIWERSETAVFKLENENSRCTSFHIGNGYLITAAHCVEEISPEIDLGNKKIKPLILSDNNNVDIAILWDPELGSYPYLELGTSSDIKLWDNVYVIGFPGKSPFKMMDIGYLIGLEKSSEEEKDIIFTSGNAVPGESGGPLLNSKGFVIGITSKIAPISISWNNRSDLESILNPPHIHRDIAIFTSVITIREELDKVIAKYFPAKETKINGLYFKYQRYRF